MNTANYTTQILPSPEKATGDSAQLIFHPHALRELGFTDRGATWSNFNEQLHTMDTQIGILCVVGFSRVYLIHGAKEDCLARLNSVRLLTLFIEMLS